jgi:ZIP family zinc transporter
MSLFEDISILQLALYGGLFTFFLTGVGSLGIFFLKRTSPKVFSVSLGMAGGIMIAASFWSLLNPALEIAKETYSLAFIPVVIGFILGIILLRIIDITVPHLHMASLPMEQEGPHVPLKKSILILLAITIHNIPEGLAVGVSFGSASDKKELLLSAYNLTLGIGFQNIPEGLALALALKHSGITRFKSFFYGFFSAVVEPIFSLVGAGATLFSHLILPYALSLAAGAMMFVTIEELLPEAQKFGNSDLASLGFGAGFLIMMILDTALS